MCRCLLSCSLAILFMGPACQRATEGGGPDGQLRPPSDLALSQPSVGYRVDLSWRNSATSSARVVRLIRAPEGSCSVENPEPEGSIVLGEFSVLDPGGAQSYTDTYHLFHGQGYCYAVFAKEGTRYSQGVFETIVSTDAVPPEPVTDFAAQMETQPGSYGFSLTWVLPLEDHLSAVVVNRRSDGQPDSPADPLAYEVCRGTGTSCIDGDALDGVTYQYRAWVLDVAQNVSSPVDASDSRPFVDDDGDGFREDEGDCDDSDPVVYPGAHSRDCSERDYDCDGDGYEVTFCTDHLQTDSQCVLAPTECSPASGGCDYHLKPDMILCSSQTDPDYDYDVCVNGQCISPGSCVGAGCMISGPYYSIPPSFGRTDLVRQENGSEPTVSDPVTKIMWQGCVSGLTGLDCSGATAASPFLSWQDAFAHCDSLNWAGFNDWYLPDVFEFSTILDLGQAAPTMDRTLFVGMPADRFWVSTNYYESEQYAWHFWLQNGQVDFRDRNDELRVMCVRRTEQVDYLLPRLVRDYTAAEHPVVKDSATGLEWQGCPASDASPPCSSSFVGFTWEFAVRYCDTLVWAGKNDWRSPHVTELFSLVRPGGPAPPCYDWDLFPYMGKFGAIWTITEVADDNGKAFGISSTGGSFGPTLKTHELGALCVRDGD